MGRGKETENVSYLGQLEEGGVRAIICEEA
jgi:hypothetical protein